MSRVSIRYINPGTRQVEIREVPALPCGVPGLVIGPAEEAEGWALTHIRSGCALLWFPDADPEAVLAAAQAISGLADWTASADAIIATPGLRARVLAAAREWGGCMDMTQGAAGPDRTDLPAVTP